MLVCTDLPRRYQALVACFTVFVLWILVSTLAPYSNFDRFQHRYSTSADTNSEANPHSPWALIPRKIWQTAPPYDTDTADVFENSWHTLNPYWRYELLDDAGAETFVNDTFTRTWPDVVDIYHRIETPILRVDLLRYLLIFHHGGLYADVDVDCKKPIDDWLGKELRQETGMILGLEYDDTVHKDMPNISLAQYVFVARPHHPILDAVIREALSQLEQLGDQASPNGESRPGIISASESWQILDATGPYMFARVVFDTLNGSGNFEDPSQLHLIREPVRFGDVVILSINGFGWGQDHSRSGDLDMGERLAQHKFRQSWKNHVTWALDFSWRKKADGTDGTSEREGTDEG